jgi:hypothetical protein
MVDFRKGIIALAVLALFAGLASAQVGGSGLQTQLTCSTGVTYTPQLRNEGWTEQTGDITITCTGGSLLGLAPGNAIPLVNFTIFYNAPVTSRLLTTNTSSNNINEALLTIDEPGNTALPGAGPLRNQKICATPFSGCQAYVQSNAGVIYAAADNSATSDGTNYAANVYQGVASPVAGNNAVTFFGVPVLPPTTTGQRVFRITNVRVSAVNSPNQGQIFAQITVSPNSLGIINSQLAVGYVNTSLSSSNDAVTVQQCTPVTRSTTGLLKFSELFGTAFKTRTAAQVNNAYQAQTVSNNQNIPGAIYNSESNFILGTANGTAGLADFGTRLKATFNNVPTGVRIYVSTTNVNNSVFVAPAPTVPGGTSIASYAQLVTSDTATYGATPSATGAPFVQATTPTSGTVTLSEVLMTGGSGSATWEVINTNPNTNETFNFAYYVTVTPNLPSNLPTPGDITVNMGYAPLATSAVASSSAPIPRFRADPNNPKLLTVIVCRTILLFPYVVNQIGLDTGIAIANTSQDPFTTGSPTAAQNGECSMTFYSSDPAAVATLGPFKLPVAGGTTTTIAGGRSGVGLTSTFAPGFQGYMFAICNFQYAHGFAFISDIGVKSVAMGYLAIVLEDPGTGARPASPPCTGIGGCPTAGEQSAH